MPPDAFCVSFRATHSPGWKNRGMMVSKNQQEVIEEKTEPLNAKKNGPTGKRRFSGGREAVFPRLSLIAKRG